LRPEASCLVVVEQDIGSVKLARNSKRVTLSVE
jgi:hypothetical protein